MENLRKKILNLIWKRNNKFVLLFIYTIVSACSVPSKEENNTIMLKNVIIDFVVDKKWDCRTSRIHFNYLLNNNSNVDIVLKKKSFNFCKAFKNDPFIILNDSIEIKNRYKYIGDFTKLSLHTVDDNIVIEPKSSKLLDCILNVDIYASSIEELKNDLANYFSMIQNVKNIKVDMEEITYVQNSSISIRYKLDDIYISLNDTMKMNKGAESRFLPPR